MNGPLVFIQILIWNEIEINMDFYFVFQGGTKNGTDLIKMATRIHHQNLAPRTTAPDVDERKHEIGSTSRGQCLLKLID